MLKSKGCARYGGAGGGNHGWPNFLCTALICSLLPSNLTEGRPRRARRRGPSRINLPEREAPLQRAGGGELQPSPGRREALEALLLVGWEREGKGKRRSLGGSSSSVNNTIGLLCRCLACQEEDYKGKGLLALQARRRGGGADPMKGMAGS